MSSSVIRAAPSQGDLRLDADNDGRGTAQRIMCEISSRVREANESMTSIAVTSTMTPWSVAHHLLHQAVRSSRTIRVRQRGLDRRDENASLL